MGDGTCSHTLNFWQKKIQRTFLVSWKSEAAAAHVLHALNSDEAILQEAIRSGFPSGTTLRMQKDRSNPG